MEERSRWTPNANFDASGMHRGALTWGCYNGPSSLQRTARSARLSELRRGSSRREGKGGGGGTEDFGAPGEHKFTWTGCILALSVVTSALARFPLSFGFIYWCLMYASERLSFVATYCFVT